MSEDSKAKPKEAKADAPAAAAAEQPAGDAKPEDGKAESPATEAAAEAEAKAESKPEPANDPDPPKAEAKADPEPDAEEAASDPAPDPEPNRTAELESEVGDLRDRLLRAAAEMENMRRRFEREMADARQYAVTGFAREVLSIGDNLGRALAAVPEEARKEGGALSGLIEGVEMTERELLRVLNKHNVKRLEPHGEKFDPHFHQAMFEVEHDEAPHGTVVQVVQPGYSIGERVLRPAMVGIAKAKKKTEKPAEAKEKEAETSSGEEKEKAANNG